MWLCNLLLPCAKFGWLLLRNLFGPWNTIKYLLFITARVLPSREKWGRLPICNMSWVLEFMDTEQSVSSWQNIPQERVSFSARSGMIGQSWVSHAYKQAKGCRAFLITISKTWIQGSQPILLLGTWTIQDVWRNATCVTTENFFMKLTFHWLSISVGLWYNLKQNLLSLSKILHPKRSQHKMKRGISYYIQSICFHFFF